MLFSIYPRQNESSAWKKTLLEARANYSSGDIDRACFVINSFEAEDRETKILTALAHCFFILYSKTRQSERNWAVENLYNQLSIDSQCSYLNLDNDIIHDIYSILNLAYLNNIKLRSNLDLESNLNSTQALENIYTPKTKRPAFCVVIPSTGFFSFIEHIVFVDYIAFTYGLAIQISLRHWPFKRSLANILPLSKAVIVNEDNCENFRDLDLSILYNIRKDFGLLQHTLVSKFKKTFYERLFRQLFQYNLAHNSYKNIDNCMNQNVLFLRRGDKLARETILPTTEVILDSMQSKSSFIIMSDDSEFAHQIKTLRGNTDVIFELRKIQGYNFFNDKHNDIAFWDVVCKWLIMVKAAELHACTYSNLVNTAFIARAQHHTFNTSSAFFIRPSTFI